MSDLGQARTKTRHLDRFWQTLLCPELVVFDLRIVELQSTHTPYQNQKLPPELKKKIAGNPRRRELHKRSNPKSHRRDPALRTSQTTRKSDHRDPTTPPQATVIAHFINPQSDLQRKEEKRTKRREERGGGGELPSPPETLSVETSRERRKIVF